jgi:uncharacterized protein YbjT (DUF2867 family)
LLDISDCAVAVLSESVEKHDRNVYDLAGEMLSSEKRAAIFSKVLSKAITYEQQSVEDLYKRCIGLGISHSMAYNFSSTVSSEKSDTTTPQAAIIIGRPLRTLQEWLTENVKAFQ